jgi:hypothetical protein
MRSGWNDGFHCLSKGPAETRLRTPKELEALISALNIPSLDEVAADPSRALGLSREVIAAPLNRCSGAQIALTVALASPATPVAP